MKDLEEKLLRDMLGDLVASKGATRKVITENIVTFVKKITTQQSAQRTGGTSCNCTLYPSESTKHKASCPANPANR